MKRQLAAQALLDQDLLADTAAADTAVLQEYFRAHESEFFLREEMIKVNLIVLARREEASAFAAAVSQGVSWKSASAKLASDAGSAQTIRASAAERYYSQTTLVPAELWKVAGTLNINEVSIPVRLSDGFAVLQLLARLGEGKSAGFDLARDEVAARAAMERRLTRYEALLASLRGSTTVQVMLPEASASDTTSPLPHD